MTDITHDRYFIEFRHKDGDWTPAEGEGQPTPECLADAATFLMENDFKCGAPEYRVTVIQPDAMPRDVTFEVLQIAYHVWAEFNHYQPQTVPDYLGCYAHYDFQTAYDSDRRNAA